MKHKWTVSFDENGGEYTGYLFIEGKAIKQTEAKTFWVDGVKITIDERIQSITLYELEESNG